MPVKLPPMSRGEIMDLRSVLLRALQRKEMERKAHPDIDDPDEEELARAVKDLDDELARFG